MLDSSVRLNNIPSAWTSFVGRDVERAQIKDFLEHSTNPIMLVYGPRGVGKSSLVCCVANELKEKFSSVVWLDRSNALGLFQKLSSNDLNFQSFEKADSSDLTEIGQKIFVKLRQKNEEINSDLVSVARKALVDFPGKDPIYPFLLIVDDFDEEYSLGTTTSSELDLCDYIEQFVQYPNKLIITSRLRENCFRGLGHETLEVGLLQEQDVDLLVKRHMGKLDSAVLVNGRVEDTSAYIWNISGGLAEFVSRNIIPITTQQEFLLGRDPESNKAIREFAQCYLLEREQPSRLDGYRVILKPGDLESRLTSLFTKDSFTEFILWKWLNLNLTNGYSENDLGIALGINILDDAMAAKLHNALRDLHKNRFIARQLYEVDGETPKQVKMVTKWILLPLISSYLREYWPKDRQHWNNETVYLHNFVDAYIDQPEKIEIHYKRIFDVISWCYANQDWNNLVSLGISVSKTAGKLIETDSLPRDSTTYEILVDICRKTADVLEQQKDTESWRPLIYVLLILAKLYSSAKADSSQLLFKKAREYAVRALTLSQENQSSEELDATVLTAKLHIYMGELDQAEALLEKVYSSKKQIKDDWALTAYYLATILRREENSLKAYSWYKKIVDSISQHSKVDIALQSAVDTSRYCSNINLEYENDVLDILVKASEFIKHNTDYIKKFPLLSVQVLAHCAAAYEKRQELLKYKGLLLEAKQYCKDFGLEQHPVYKDLNNRLVYLSQKESGTSLFDDLVVSTSQESDALYGFDEIFGNCPICRRRLHSAVEVISCSKCDSSYHKDCLVDANLHLCPVCNEAFNLTKEE